MAATEPDPDADPTPGPDPERRARLASTLVENPDSADRCTVFPPEATGVERMSTWLTADAAAFVDLDDAR